MEQCAAADCEAPAAVRVFVPWDEDRDLCAAHARPLAREDGVVAQPIEDADEEFP